MQDARHAVKRVMPSHVQLRAGLAAERAAVHWQGTGQLAALITISVCTKSRQDPEPPVYVSEAACACDNT